MKVDWKVDSMVGLRDLLLVDTMAVRWTEMRVVWMIVWMVE